MSSTRICLSVTQRVAIEGRISAGNARAMVALARACRTRSQTQRCSVTVVLTAWLSLKRLMQISYKNTGGRRRLGAQRTFECMHCICFVIWEQWLVLSYVKGLNSATYVMECSNSKIKYFLILVLSTQRQPAVQLQNASVSRAVLFLRFYDGAVCCFPLLIFQGCFFFERSKSRI